VKVARARSSPHYFVPLLAAAMASLSLVGADCRWLVALGGTVARGHLPTSLPFASAPTSGWHDAPAFAELVLHGLWRAFGDRGLVLAQVLAALCGFGALAAGLRRESRTPGGAASAALLVLAGSLPSVAVIRNGLFSLALFPVLLLLVQRESRRPSARIWLAVPLLALWANLHGAVLVGYALLAVYVVVARRREAPGVLLAGAIALCATPVLWHTPDYYLGVAHNEAARRGVGLWAGPSLRGFDIALAITAFALVVTALRDRRWHAWEAVAVAGLAAATIHSVRLGVFLLFVLAYPAARAADIRRPEWLPQLLYLFLAVFTVVGLAHGPVDGGSHRLAAEAARHGPVLSEGVLAEQVELAGGVVWVSNPLDAFRAADQRLYLDWLEGHGPGAVDHARSVLVRRRSDAARAAARDKRLRRVDSDDRAVLYRVLSPKAPG